MNAGADYGWKEQRMQMGLDPLACSVGKKPTEVLASGAYRVLEFGTNRREVSDQPIVIVPAFAGLPRGPSS